MTHESWLVTDDWSMILSLAHPHHHIKDVVAGMAFLHTLSPPILHGNLNTLSVHLDASFQVRKIILQALTKLVFTYGAPFHLGVSILFLFHAYSVGLR